jgi:uncharacterized RDD family membrane protein YckC
LRLGGWLLDWLILIVVNLAVLIPAGAFHRIPNAFGTGTTYHLSALGVLLPPLITILYGTIFIGSARGQTVGMMATGVRVVHADTGARVSYGMALWRAFFEYLMFWIIVIPWIVDMLFPLWDPRNQTLHDKVASTIVVKN